MFVVVGSNPNSVNSEFTTENDMLHVLVHGAVMQDGGQKDYSLMRNLLML